MLKIILSILLFCSISLGGDVLPAGSEAPDFTLIDAGGQMHQLTSYRGKKVVLYFYPKNNTPGCTSEACNLRDNFDVLQEIGIVVLGVSYDSPESHKKFRKKHSLPFTLLSDRDKKVAGMYGTKGGVLGFMGAKRITYLIDEQGIIMHRFDKVDSANHARQILYVLEETDN